MVVVSAQGLVGLVAGQAVELGRDQRMTTWRKNQLQKLVSLARTESQDSLPQLLSHLVSSAINRSVHISASTKRGYRPQQFVCR